MCELLRWPLRGGILTWVKRDQIKMASCLIGALHVRPVQCTVCMNFSRTVWRWALFVFLDTNQWKMWTHYKGKKRKKQAEEREREGGGKKGENKIKLESEEERKARLREKQVIHGERERLVFFFFFKIQKTLLKTRNGGTYNKRENRLRYGH